MLDLKSYLLGKHGGAYTPPADLPSWLAGKKKSSPIETLTGTPPLTFIANGQPLIDYTIYGANTRSENLLQIVPDMLDAENWEEIAYSPGSVFFMYYELSSAQVQEILANANMAGTVYLKPNGAYYNGEVFAITNAKTPTINNAYRLLQNDGTTFDFSRSTTGWSSVYLSIGYGNKITPTNKQTLINAFFDNYDVMLNAGTEPLPYEPYWIPGVGDADDNKYAIPLTINGQTYTIYLDAPLGEGESISFVDTGIDIPTVKGVNTLSVDTIVQPKSVTIVYNK